MFWRKKKQDADWTSDLGQPVAAATPHIQVVGNASPEQVKQAMDMAERFMNADLDGDGKVAGGEPAQGVSPMAGVLGTMGARAALAPTDVVGQLERLAKLHETGALTDEEFAAQKAKLLR
jgi:hypothetical protein